VDFHAATGPGGGGAALQVDPGDEKSMTFKTLVPGLYVYRRVLPYSCREDERIPPRAAAIEPQHAPGSARRIKSPCETIPINFPVSSIGAHSVVLQHDVGGINDGVSGTPPFFWSLFDVLAFTISLASPAEQNTSASAC